MEDFSERSAEAAQRAQQPAATTRQDGLRELLNEYLVGLAAYADATAHYGPEAKRQDVELPKSLEDQIFDLTRGWPTELRTRPWQISELVSRLTGLSGGRPHPQGVGQALRRLGWKRVRRWDQGAAGLRLWMPPS